MLLPTMFPWRKKFFYCVMTDRSDKVKMCIRDRYIAALLLACCVEGYAQEKKQAAFVPPFDFPLTSVSYPHLFDETHMFVNIAFLARFGIGHDAARHGSGYL